MTDFIDISKINIKDKDKDYSKFDEKISEFRKNYK
jgi:hypothetical protein